MKSWDTILVFSKHYKSILVKHAGEIWCYSPITFSLQGDNSTYKFQCDTLLKFEFHYRRISRDGVLIILYPIQCKKKNGNTVNCEW